MKMKLKTSYLLKITAIVMVWGIISVQFVFAQEKILDSQTLSPAVYFDAQSFLDIYRQTYSNTDLDSQHE